MAIPGEFRWPPVGRNRCPLTCVGFFEHYNHIHRHSGIALHAPASVHYGTATEIRNQRQATLIAAYTANPIRFRRRPPVAPVLPEVAWINPPSTEEVARIF